jgi:hypothetical protein
VQTHPSLRSGTYAAWLTLCADSLWKQKNNDFNSLRTTGPFSPSTFGFFAINPHLTHISESHPHLSFPEHFSMPRTLALVDPYTCAALELEMWIPGFKSLASNAAKAVFSCRQQHCHTQMRRHTSKYAAFMPSPQRVYCKLYTGTVGVCKLYTGRFRIQLS